MITQAIPWKQILRNLDWKPIPFILGLMGISLYVISSTTTDSMEPTFWTPYVKSQLMWFGAGWGVYLALACFDYRKLRDYALVLYVVMIVLLIGLFFTEPIQNVRRWYRIPFFHFALQPSEYAKLALVIALSCFLEKQADQYRKRGVALAWATLVALPFFLVLKQPDLGTALILLPISLVLFYFGSGHPRVVKWACVGGVLLLGVVLSFFLGLVSHADLKPSATKIIKEYQYERLNPDTYHQNAAKTAIALGHLTGSGWHQSEFTARHFLPAGHTDSVFPAFVEETGLFGAILILLLFFGMIYFMFQVTASAADPFGRLLSAGIATYMAIHVIVNMGMMAGLLPVTGVPLTLVSYGGSSVLASMGALGILQSVYARRFMF